MPPTRTFGFRWTAWEVLWWTAAELGALEWKARSDPSEENSERTLCQDKWGRPYDSPGAVTAELDWRTIARRAVEARPRGHVPAGTHKLAMFVDVHRRFLAWACTAFSADGSPHVADHGSVPVRSEEHGEEFAILMALREARDLAEAGWFDDTAGAAARRPADIMLVDSGYQSDAVYAWARESRGRTLKCWAAKGLGGEIMAAPHGHGTARPNRKLLQRGDGYSIVALAEQHIALVEIEPDHWKTWLRNRIETQRGEMGAWTLFAGDLRTHQQFAHEITAESPVTDYSRARGRDVTKWVQKPGKRNEALDCCAGCGVAGHMAGVRLLESSVARPADEAGAPDYRPADEKSAWRIGR